METRITQAISRLLHCVSDPVWTRDVHGLAADAGMTLRYRDDGKPFKWVGWRVRGRLPLRVAKGLHTSAPRREHSSTQMNRTRSQSDRSAMSRLVGRRRNGSYPCY